ncbi:RE1-silencing transcription factor [Frankliniella fusca]|uniref:RE1-silencing transcription factor n=1 Tax=Frankliniella fusca TaxID=407009 RepID=A0AAE1I3M3_9NEOP|nr:RE1-silencing transcription factor [Frankliniella fusca]
MEADQDEIWGVSDREFEELTALYYEMVGAEAAEFLNGPEVEQVLDQLDAADGLMAMSERAAATPPAAEDVPRPPVEWLAPPPPLLSSLPSPSAVGTAGAAPRRRDLVGNEEALRQAALRSVDDFLAAADASAKSASVLSGEAAEEVRAAATAAAAAAAAADAAAAAAHPLKPQPPVKRPLEPPPPPLKQPLVPPTLKPPVQPPLQLPLKPLLQPQPPRPLTSLPPLKPPVQPLTTPLLPPLVLKPLLKLPPPTPALLKPLLKLPPPPPPLLQQKPPKPPPMPPLPPLPPPPPLPPLAPVKISVKLPPMAPVELLPMAPVKISVMAPVELLPMAPVKMSVMAPVKISLMAPVELLPMAPVELLPMAPVKIRPLDTICEEALANYAEDLSLHLDDPNALYLNCPVCYAPVTIDHPSKGLVRDDQVRSLICGCFGGPDVIKTIVRKEPAKLIKARYISVPINALRNCLQRLEDPHVEELERMVRALINRGTLAVHFPGTTINDVTLAYPTLRNINMVRKICYTLELYTDKPSVQMLNTCKCTLTSSTETLKMSAPWRLNSGARQAGSGSGHFVPCYPSGETYVYVRETIEADQDEIWGVSDREFEELTALYYEMVGAEAAEFLNGPEVEQVLDQLDAADGLMAMSERAAATPPAAEDVPRPPVEWLAPPPPLLSPLPSPSAVGTAGAAPRRRDLVGNEEALRQAALRSVSNRRLRLLAGGGEVQRRHGGGRRAQRRPEQEAAVYAEAVVAPEERRVPEARPRTPALRLPPAPAAPAHAVAVAVMAPEARPRPPVPAPAATLVEQRRELRLTVWQRLGGIPTPGPSRPHPLTDEEKAERRWQAMLKPNPILNDKTFSKFLSRDQQLRNSVYDEYLNI